jgi:hypothetical protein
MVALDYNILISQASTDVEKVKRKVYFFFTANRGMTILANLLSFVARNQQPKFAKTINYQLFMSSWLFRDASKNYETNIANKDWNSMIEMLNKLINYNIEIQDKFEKYICKNQGEENSLEKYSAEIRETIDNLYACLRLFKKANIKAPLLERSDLAESAIKRTQHTLKTIHAD